MGVWVAACDLVLLDPWHGDRVVDELLTASYGDATPDGFYDPQDN